MGCVEGEKEWEREKEGEKEGEGEKGVKRDEGSGIIPYEIK